MGSVKGSLRRRQLYQFKYKTKKQSLDLIEELAGSVPMPTKWKGKDIDEIIDEAKRKHFAKKYKILQNIRHKIS